jgi:hypothetical protein
MDEKFVVVDRVVGGLQGEIIKGLLQASGIQAQAFGQGGAREIGVSAVAEVDIVVPVGQEAEARLILEAYYSGELDQGQVGDSEEAPDDFE